LNKISEYESLGYLANASVISKFVVLLNNFQANKKV
jgi:hypothetical protein